MKDLTASLRPARLSDTADLHQNCFPAEPPEAVQSYLRWCLGTGQRSRIVRMRFSTYSDQPSIPWLSTQSSKGVKYSNG